jgi:hypothetical protein
VLAALAAVVPMSTVVTASPRTAMGCQSGWRISWADGLPRLHEATLAGTAPGFPLHPVQRTPLQARRLKSQLDRGPITRLQSLAFFSAHGVCRERRAVLRLRARGGLGTAPDALLAGLGAAVELAAGVSYIAVVIVVPLGRGATSSVAAGWLPPWRTSQMAIRCSCVESLDSVRSTCALAPPPHGEILHQLRQFPLCLLGYSQYP